eukprot:TRINITY_DN57355_c0_g1_i1.p1 TRINITY_DN57355_c0_g1~~TRINITY_DN57355_c0_g1_i1.p1  ORF type:complete len:788 (+),score=107.46 TRINITY_DN57355_c0_g1_i1:236-2599(+)
MQWLLIGLCCLCGLAAEVGHDVNDVAVRIDASGTVSRNHLVRRHPDSAPNAQGVHARTSGETMRRHSGNAANPSAQHNRTSAVHSVAPAHVALVASSRTEEIVNETLKRLEMDLARISRVASELRETVANGKVVLGNVSGSTSSTAGSNGSLPSASAVNVSKHKATPFDIPRPGDPVVIENVTEQKQLSGQTGILMSFNSSKKMWRVKLDDGGVEVFVLPENLASPPKTVRSNSTAAPLHISTPQASPAKKLWFDRRELLPVVFMGFFPVMLLISTGCRYSRRIPAPGAVPADGRHLREQSLAAITAITAYKFYIGFLNSTWVPFLIAREGEKLLAERQAAFMGVEKLIYGASLITNPLLGRWSDKLAEHSSYFGRSMFIIVGVGLEGVALCYLRIASATSDTSMFLTASCVLMLGEALVDVVTEALPPLVLPLQQYDLASSVRSLHFMFGGLTGYVALMYLYDVPYTWMYVAYMVLMFICAAPALWFLARLPTKSDEAGDESRKRWPSCADIYKSYVEPSRIPGPFTLACFCIFCFGGGGGPIFYMLLIVRDLVGFTDQAEQQMHFSGISIVFLLSAALSAAMTGTGSAESASDSASPLRDSHGGTGGTDEGLPAQQERQRRPSFGGLPPASQAEGLQWGFFWLAVVLYGICSAVAPVVVFGGDARVRLKLLYALSFPFGFYFGQVYARFKSLTWMLLPPGVDVANAMAFAGVAQVAGMGLGNFAAGCILDEYRLPGKELHYSPTGYFVMAWSSAAVIFLSGFLTTYIVEQRGCRMPGLARLMWMY